MASATVRRLRDALERIEAECARLEKQAEAFRLQWKSPLTCRQPSSSQTIGGLP